MANIRLYALRHDKSLSTHAVANFTRSELATALRKVLLITPMLILKQTRAPSGTHACVRLMMRACNASPCKPLCAQRPYSTNLLIAGWDEKTGPALYWMDYLATMHAMNIAGTGYGAALSEN